VRQVRLHRLLADAELTGYELVRQPLGDAAKNVELTLAELSGRLLGSGLK
jgi:hypothetical protein